VNVVGAAPSDPSKYGDSVELVTPQATTRKDRFIARLVSFLARSVYRDIEVYIPSGLPEKTPMLTVSNHFGGFSDALVLLDVLPRRPGIVARDVIWKIPIVGAFMNWVGGIPVHKPEDKGSATSNDEMFSSCYRALDDGGHILIFPEGVTRNEPSIAPVKTGAARIALGARAQGATDLSIVPVGIHYEDKAALRSRVFVNVGVPIDVDAAVARDNTDDQAVDANNREAVGALTDEIATSLRRAAPDFADWTEASLLAQGADIVLRSQLADPAGDVDLGLRDRYANTLADLGSEQRAEICTAVSRYREDLDAVGYSDAELNSRITAGHFSRSFLGQLLVGLFLLPFAVVGALINVIPFLIVKGVGVLRVAPSMLSTLKPVAAFASFSITWGIVIWRVMKSFGWEGGVVAFVLLPVYLAAVILLVERATSMWRLLRRRRASTSVSKLGDEIAAHRNAVVETVLAS
jgi:glycerol-3-phosphate O-acyltransferase/dihydroxyacetone phosphate acyltransferase